MAVPASAERAPERLTKDDPHHWYAIPKVIVPLCERLPVDARVLEIGPGTGPFPRADVFVDFVDLPNLAGRPLVKCDVSKEKLPFPDKSFDFVVCRHTLEDMFNPFPVCAEMSRVAKAGYIETPSPLAELCRGVDGASPPWRGYHHHRFVVWESDGELRFVSKYPVVEHLKGAFDADIVRALTSGPKYWNTHHLWEGEIRLKHLQSPLDFDIPKDYGQLLTQAIRDSVAATTQFWTRLTGT